nr:MAG TPA: hypothetical protein [Caudoviricetes sp.]
MRITFASYTFGDWYQNTIRSDTAKVLLFNRAA